MECLYMCRCKNIKLDNNPLYRMAPPSECMDNVMLVVATDPCMARHVYQMKSRYIGQCKLEDIEVHEVKEVDRHDVCVSRDLQRAVRRMEPMPAVVVDNSPTKPKEVVCSNCRKLWYDYETMSILSDNRLHNRIDLDFEYCPYCGQRTKHRKVYLNEW